MPKGRAAQHEAKGAALRSWRFILMLSPWQKALVSGPGD